MGVAETAERVRDLRKQVAELDNHPENEILFQEISPRRQRIMLYSTENGEPTPIPEYMIPAALSAVRPDGKPRFVAKKEDAPEYIEGQVKCFLHAESPEREVLAELGMAGITCPAEHLANVHSKRIHAENRHKRQWAALQEHIKDQKEKAALDRQEQQLNATLALAGKASEPAFRDAVETPRTAPPSECDVCGKTGFKNVGAHKRGAHNERA